MTAEERQYRLGEYLQKMEFASLEELSQQVDASVSTIRRDLAVLEAAGQIRRTHGGARMLSPRSDEFAFTARDTRELPEKEAIGRACAELVRPNQILILDAGTTVYHVARYLEAKTPQIFTNSLPIVNLFASAPRVEVMVSGGVVYPRLGVLVGPLSAEAFARMNADVAIMGAGGITLEGIFNSHGLLIEIQKTMIKAAQKVIFCVDHTKFGRRSVSPLCGLDCVHVVVTDHLAPPDMVSALRDRGVEVVIADATAGNSNH